MVKKRKLSARRKHGYCKLTHRPGVFVKSHIIPEALTKVAQRGMPLIQCGDAVKPSRRWTSWYDAELVTREGEDILSALDTWAISVLRKHKLVWSGWEHAVDLGDLHARVEDDIGVREVEIDGKKLRLFFHSLLWRAAASERYEFKEVALPSFDLELLRKTLLGLAEPDVLFYPVQLTQLSTRGRMHNQTPYLDVKYIPNLDDPNGEPYPLRTIRFYFDGLVAHIAIDPPPFLRAPDLGKIIVGAAPTLALSTVTFEGSLQGREMLKIVQQYYPDDDHST